MTIPATRLLILFFTLAGESLTKSNAFVELFDDQDQPSCDELRSFWNDVSRARKMAELTNEIPTVPWEILTRSDNLQKTYGHRRRKEPRMSQTFSPQDSLLKQDEESVLTVPANSIVFPSMFSPADRYSVSFPHQDIHTSDDSFGDFFPSSRDFGRENLDMVKSANSLEPMPDAKRRGESSSSNHWGDPRDVGSFGSFIDLEGLPLLSENTGANEEIGKWPDISRLKEPSLVSNQKSCRQIVNKMCTTDQHCTCTGVNKMRCHRGKCNIRNVDYGKESEYGIFHSGPFSRSQLGAFKRKTADGSIVM